MQSDRYGGGANEDGVNVLALAKGDERFIFIYGDESRQDVLRAIGRWAANPELDFSWYDAAVLSRKVRQPFQTDKSD